MTNRTGTRPESPQASESRPTGPIRTCIGCRGTDSRSALLRVVAESATSTRPEGANPNGVVAVIPDPGQRLPGRGAWLHPDPSCCDLAVRRRAFGRALGISAPTDLTRVTAYVTERSQNRNDRPEGTRERV